MLIIGIEHVNSIPFQVAVHMPNKRQQQPARRVQPKRLTGDQR